MTDLPTGFEEFYLATKDRCFRALLATVANSHEADDLLAEAYTRAFANWSSVAAHPAPSAWIVRTALNLHRDRWRKRRRLHLAAPVEEQQSTFSADVDPAILASIARLPTRQREVVIYRVLLDLGAHDTAQELGIDPGTVGTHLRRALDTLRSDLRESVTSTTSTEAHS
jgi:RNA polymerase sigma factor (sigma-70 family)